MLEVARALSQGPPLDRPVVLLFNGAEENNQQGSHGFITQHRWAGEVHVDVLLLLLLLLVARVS